MTTSAGGFQITIQPDADSENDPGNGCYFTGNVTDLQGGVLIGGSTRLISPVFDGTQMEEPWVSFESWFLNINTSGSGLGNDIILVRVDNGITTATLTSIEFESLFAPIEWTAHEINIAQQIELTENMQIFFEIFDNDFNDASEAGIDNFKIFDNPSNSLSDIDKAAFSLKAFPNPTERAFSINFRIEDWQRGGNPKSVQHGRSGNRSYCSRSG